MDRKDLIKARLLKRKRRLEWERAKAQAEVEAAARRVAVRRAIEAKKPSKQSLTFTLFPNRKPKPWR